MDERTAATVELTDICKAYGDFVAVDHLSLSIQPGRIYGFLGPNGAGKTSTIRMMIGIIIPDSGQVSFFGEPLRRAHMEQFGYLPEERGLYRKMKVLEHLIFLAQLKGLSASEAQKRAEHWCERFDLTSWTDKKVEELSKGMQQKVQFIGAILHDPKLIIMDEPTSALDVVAQRSLMRQIENLRHRLGFAVLFVTHDMSVVSHFSDRLAVMYAGEFVELGATRDVFDRPRHPYSSGLMDAFPSLVGEAKILTGIAGNPPSLVNPPGGCLFAPRCQFATDECRSVRPELITADGRAVRCHLVNPRSHA